MTREVTVLTEAELRRVVAIDADVIDTIADAFAALATGAVIMPPVMSMEIPAANGEVDVKTAYVLGLDAFAIKVSPGFFDNPKLGLPSLNGLMILFSATTGLVVALFLDNGYLTDVRTAAAGAVAARLLAPEIETAGVLGTGRQARLQIEAAYLVRRFRRVLVWGRDPDKAAACAGDIAASLEIEAQAESDPARLVAESQFVVTTTAARSPVLQADWLHPSLHITAMGADQSAKNEIDPAVFSRLDLYVPDRASQCENIGELRAAREAGIASATAPPLVELGDVLRDPAQGRQSDTDISLCDLTGTGVQDTAIANLAIRRAIKQSVGSIIRV